MSTHIDQTLGAALDGVRLDRVVALAADISRAAAARLVDAGSVRLDDNVVTARARRVAAGQRLAVADIARPDGGGSDVPRADRTVEFTIAYSDDHVVVVDKPAGLVVHPGSGNPCGTLVNGLLARYPEMAEVGDPMRPGIVHRLDRFSSGLMVAARSVRAYESLTQQLRARQPVRVYWALVEGRVAAEEGIIEAPVGRSRRHPTRMAVTERGRPAVTRYTVLERFAEPVARTLVSCRLETGRTHQIRVHMRAIGHPVAGDHVYGASPHAAASRIGDCGLRRPFLHARSLTFRHPSTDDLIGFESELPAELVDALASGRPAAA